MHKLASDKKYKMNKHQINYLETNSYLFIGPYQEDESASCFDCFLHQLKSNESKYFYYVDVENSQNDFENLANGFNDQEKFVNKVLIINKSTMEQVWKSVLKTPFCDSCGKDYVYEPKESSNSEYMDTKYRVKSLKNIQKRIDDLDQLLVDRDVGIGKFFFRDAESDIIPMYAIESTLNKRIYHSYGRTSTIGKSKLAAQLEMIERYSSMVPYFSRVIRGSYEELNKDESLSIVPPEEYNLRKGQDFPRNDEIVWGEVLDLHSKKTSYLPEQILYFDNQLLRNEKRFIYETSNGTALGGSLNEAIMYAIFEAIERDSFLSHWYTQKLPKLVLEETIENDEIKQLIYQYRQLGYELHILDITLETDIPVVWILMRNTNEDANLYLYSAAGAHYDPEEAILAALVEVGTSIIVYEKQLKDTKKNLVNLINHPERVLRMEDHVNYYSFKENSGVFDFIFNNIDSLDVISTSDMKPKFDFSFEKVITKIMHHHPKIYMRNMQNELLTNLDLYVVKVFIPSLQPITFGKQNERINFERLSNVAGRKIEKIGKEPHPFP